MKEEQARLGQTIAERRRELGMSLRDVTSGGALSLSGKHKIETGERLPSRRSLEALSVALKCGFVIHRGVTAMMPLLLKEDAGGRASGV